MKIRLPRNDTATINSVRVALKALVGFVIGLAVTIAGVPGVSDAVMNYIRDNWVQVALTFGIPSAVSTGLINLIFDWRKKGLDNY